MKIRTAVALSEDLLAAIDERVRQSGEERSEVIEAAVRFFMARPNPVPEGAQDLEILNEQADRLNLEAEDVLTYQVIP